MKYIPLIFADILTKKVRFIFVILSLAIAFFMFAYLSAIKQGFVGGVDISGVDKMIIFYKVSNFNLMPIGHKFKIKNIPGVKNVNEASWFGGYYQNRKNTFPQYAINPEDYLTMYNTGYELNEDQKQAWIADREGALIGDVIAERFGWDIGDRITLTSAIWGNKDNTNDWEFNIRGISYQKDKNANMQGMLFHHKYFDEYRAWGNDQVAWFNVQAEDASTLDEVGNRIDAFFKNSDYETKTSPEKAYSRSYLNQIGDIEAIFLSILSVVFLTLLAVTGSAMAQGIKEHISDLAVMSVIGFSSRLIAIITVVETVLVALIGSSIGIALAWLACNLFGDPTKGLLPIFHLPNFVVWQGLVLAGLFGLLIGLVPVFLILRMDKVQALRTIN